MGRYASGSNEFGPAADCHSPNPGDDRRGDVVVSQPADEDQTP